MPRTVAEIEADITLYETARNRALNAQSYSGNGRSKTNASLSEINAELRRLRTELDRATNGAIRRVEVSSVGGDWPE